MRLLLKRKTARRAHDSQRCSEGATTSKDNKCFEGVVAVGEKKCSEGQQMSE